jgi:hypothetical protein
MSAGEKGAEDWGNMANPLQCLSAGTSGRAAPGS